MSHLRIIVASWYALPILAGTLLSLGFPPSPLWPLIVPAMALYFYSASRHDRTTIEVWCGAFITGGILGFWVAYNGLGNMELLPGATVFSYIVRLSPFLFICLFGNIFAVVAIAYRFLLTNSPIFNAFIGGALYMVGEMFQQYILVGYYWGSFAHPFAAFYPALIFASLGGAFFVSFLIATTACLLSQLARTPLLARRATLVFFVALVILYAVGILLNQPTSKTGSLRVAIVQATEEDIAYDTPFIEGAISDRLKEAGNSGTDLVVYPYTPTQGIAYIGTQPSANTHGLPIASASLSDIKKWVEQRIDATSTAVVWPTAYDSAKDIFFKPTIFYQGGKTIAEYRKQLLYPYSDYYPKWMHTLGIVERNSSITPGPLVDYTQVGSWRIGNLDCSEVDQPILAQQRARESDFLLSIGSDSMFKNGGPADYSLAAARYRAAENHISMVRAALLGPSALITPYGTITKLMPEDTGGILYGVLDYYAPRQTVYNRFGQTPMYAGVLLILLLGLLARSYHKWRNY